MSISKTRPRRTGFNPLLAVLLVLVGVVGVVATLHFTGRQEFPFIDRLFGREVAAQEPTGVPICVAVRKLKPGHRIEQLDLWDPQTSFYRVIRVPEGSVDESWLIKPTELEGRVLARPKLPGKVFTEADFLPPGSSDGAVALVPEGMRLIPLEAEQVVGIDQLAFGDRFDLVMSEPIDKKVLDEAERVLESQGGANFSQRAKLVELRERTRQTVLVVNGLMIEPPDKGATARGRKAAVAVRPEEVAALMSAVALERSIACVAKSGRAGAEESSPTVIPEDRALLEELDWVTERYGEVELISGEGRDSLIVPRAAEEAPEESR